MMIHSVGISEKFAKVFFGLLVIGVFFTVMYGNVYIDQRKIVVVLQEFEQCEYIEEDGHAPRSDSNVTIYTVKQCEYIVEDIERNFIDESLVRVVRLGPDSTLEHLTYTVDSNIFQKYSIQKVEQ